MWTTLTVTGQNLCSGLTILSPPGKGAQDKTKPDGPTGQNPNPLLSKGNPSTTQVTDSHTEDTKHTSSRALNTDKPVLPDPAPPIGTDNSIVPTSRYAYESDYYPIHSDDTKLAPPTHEKQDALLTRPT